MIAAPERRDLGPEVVVAAEERLGRAMATMALGEERPSVLQMLLGKGMDLEAAHRGRTILIADAGARTEAAPGRSHPARGRLRHPRFRRDRAAAATHPRVFRPTVEDALAFVADYEAARGGLDANMRRAGLAAAVYAVAYTARCQHALVVSGTRRLVTEARAALPRFASEFLT